MKIEDKAKAYDEMVQRVKELHETGNFLTKKQMEIICPELAESEDEKMLREFNDFLCEEIEWRTNDVRDEKDRRTLNMLCYVLGKVKAWLEKQKENPKSTDSIQADCTADVKFEDRWHEVADSLPDNGREVLAKDKFGNTLLARYDGEGWDVSVYDDEDYRCHNGISKWREIPSEKQNEQKPVDYEAELKKCKDNPLYFYDKYVTVKLKPAECIPDSVKFEEGFKTGRELGFREGVESVKPAEWSANDKAFIKDCARILDENYYTESAERLLSMFPVKSTEWSEEDEKNLNEIIHFFESLCSILATEERHAENRRWLNFLKSLRPVSKESLQSWKPSEEQMEAMEYVIRDYREDGCNATANYLQEILDHLKNM